MSFATVFTCDAVEFASTSHLCSSRDHDTWHTVKISVQEIGLSSRWIFVELKGSNPPVLPIAHVALNEGWVISCNESGKTLVLHGEDAQTRVPLIQKLRFVQATDFWAFMYQVSSSRVREYTKRDRRAYRCVNDISV